MTIFCSTHIYSFFLSTFRGAKTSQHLAIYIELSHIIRLIFLDDESLDQQGKEVKPEGYVVCLNIFTNITLLSLFESLGGKLLKLFYLR